ncbi:hypothetical protein BC943DRAFT_332332 [Umbelopsis sp. AD052]|nr:hypothetical protein BC943DRAFT_332332 [Umbelopsis sp. AD052]
MSLSFFISFSHFHFFALSSFPIIVSMADGLKKSVRSLCANAVRARGKSYCLVHRRYFETSWCPDCSRVGAH